MNAIKTLAEQMTEIASRHDVDLITWGDDEVVTQPHYYEWTAEMTQEIETIAKLTPRPHHDCWRPI